MTTNNFLHRVPEPLRPAVARVLTDDGQPTRSLLSLVDLHGLKHNGSFASIVQAMQKAWRPMKNGVALNAGELPQDDAFSDYVRRQTIYHLGALGLGNSQLQPGESQLLSVRLRECAQFLWTVHDRLLRLHSDGR